jgi:hypothetical protein
MIAAHIDALTGDSVVLRMMPIGEVR